MVVTRHFDARPVDMPHRSFGVLKLLVNVTDRDARNISDVGVPVQACLAFSLGRWRHFDAKWTGRPCYVALRAKEEGGRRPRVVDHD